MYVLTDHAVVVHVVVVEAINTIEEIEIDVATDNKFGITISLTHILLFFSSIIFVVGSKIIIYNIFKVEKQTNVI